MRDASWLNSIMSELRDASQLISAMLKMRDISWLDSVASEIKDTS